MAYINIFVTKILLRQPNPPSWSNTDRIHVQLIIF